MKYDAFISYSHACDGNLAPSLQKALHRLAKPLFKFRALNIFRDGTSLSATPHLWDSIVAALEQSKYLILLASPEAAQSEWVAKEVDFWLTNRSVDTILIVVTAGDILWDNQLNDFDWPQSNCLPQNLRQQFQMEPLYVDFREIKSKNDLAYNNPEFLSKTALVASAIHGKPMNDLIGEDVKIRKRTFRIVYTVIAVLIGLSVGLFWFAYISKINENEASAQREIAVEKSDSLLIQFNISDSLAKAELAARTLAESNFKLAELERDTAIHFAEQTQRQLANNWFVLSHNTEEKLPLRAFTLALKAAQTTSASDPSFSKYLNRAIHLSAQLPNQVINLPVQEGIESAVFNDRQDLALLITDTQDCEVFSLPSGKPLFVPESIGENGLVTYPFFAADGTRINAWVHWFHPEPDPDSFGNYRLSVDWNPLEGIVYTPEDDGSIDPDDLIWAFDSFGANDEEEDETEDEINSIEVQEIQLSSAVMDAMGNGTVLIWDGRESTDLIVNEVLEDKTLKQARFAGNRIITLSDDNLLNGWSLKSKKKLWSTNVMDIEHFELSPDNTIVAVNDSIFNTSNGAKGGILIISDDGEGQYIRDKQGLTMSKERVIAWIFPWEAGEDLFLQKGEDFNSVYDVTPDQFLSFLENGRYYITGSLGSFHLSDINTSKTLASFYFGNESNVPALLADKLIRQVVTVKRHSKQRTTIRLKNGTLLDIKGPDTITKELRVLPGKKVLVAPLNYEFSEKELIALSPNGKWLAVAKEGSLSVWDAQTGYAWIEKISIKGLPLDLRFSTNNRSINIITNVGSILTIPVEYQWSEKPNWLESFGEAVSGLRINENGETVRLSLQEKKRKERQFAAQLQRAHNQGTVVKYLKYRFIN